MPRPWPYTPTWTIPWGGGGSRPEDGTIYTLGVVVHLKYRGGKAYIIYPSTSFDAARPGALNAFRFEI